MAQSTLKYQDSIDEIFADYINDGRIQCTQEDFKKKLVELQKQIKVTKKSGSTRKVSNFMTWLSSEKRSEIKDEFFSDFDEYSDWSAEGIRSYYEKKNLPLDKIEAIDMGRKGIHNEGARVLLERLEGRVVTDRDTARRLFTLIYALTYKR